MLSAGPCQMGMGVGVSALMIQKVGLSMMPVRGGVLIRLSCKGVSGANEAFNCSSVCFW